MKKRLFVAISLPEQLVEELEGLQRKLKPFARDAKWVKVNGIHLTLKFLGYVEPEQIPMIERSLLEIAEKGVAIRIQASGCGFFPNARRPSVLWVGVQAPDLMPLQQQIENAMEKLGFEKENRAFSPHLTLARFRDPRGLLPLGRETEKFKDQHFGKFTAHGFHLFQSILRPQGAEYHSLKEFSF